ncbi:hypothetical protein [Amycolatopsis sp. NPDC004169]|uniref:hypothetical protein n=1 Tax=Amycolatopsis sp. NPDC004169 TaxID=3154453 RepID=UPI0033A5339C
MQLEFKTVIRPWREAAVNYGAGDRDEDLDRLARLGDVEAFAVLAERYHRLVYLVIRAHVGSQAEAERRVVKVFCATWRDLQNPYSLDRGFIEILSHVVARSLSGVDEVDESSP